MVNCAKNVVLIRIVAVHLIMILVSSYQILIFILIKILRTESQSNLNRKLDTTKYMMEIAKSNANFEPGNETSSKDQTNINDNSNQDSKTPLTQSKKDTDLNEAPQVSDAVQNEKEV